MNSLEILDLYDKPISYKFSEVELKAIKKHQPKSDFKIRYSIYKRPSSKNMYITFIIDQMCKQSRKSGAENQWETICTRDINNTEYNEMISNFGTHHQRFIVWYYKDIETLIADDLKYKIDTPKEFIELCISKGYVSNKKKENIQLSFKFK